MINTDRGSQFTTKDWIGMAEDPGIRISMDGRGRALGNVYIERWWRSFKHEDLYLNQYQTLTPSPEKSYSPRRPKSPGWPLTSTCASRQPKYCESEKTFGRPGRSPVLYFGTSNNVRRSVLNNVRRYSSGSDVVSAGSISRIRVTSTSPAFWGSIESDCRQTLVRGPVR